MFDRDDARLVVQVAVLLLGGSSVVLTISAVAGLSVHVFRVMAGG